MRVIISLEISSRYLFSFTYSNTIWSQKGLTLRVGLWASYIIILRCLGFLVFRMRTIIIILLSIPDCMTQVNESPLQLLSYKVEDTDAITITNSIME